MWLEDRLTPAAFSWLGDKAGGFDNRYNWISDVARAPMNGDDLYFDAIPVTTPGTDGDPPSTILVCYDCDIPRTYQFNSMHILSGFDKQVITRDNTVVGLFEMFNGKLNQYGSDNDLFITHYMGIYGGVLNCNTATGSIVHLTGDNLGAATGNIAIISSIPITIGSTISVEGLGTETGGAGLAIWGGQYTIKNGADFITGAFCSTEVGKMQNAGPPGSYVPPLLHSFVTFREETVGQGVNEFTQFPIFQDGWCGFSNKFTGNVKIVSGGEVKIWAGADVELTDPAIPTKPSVVIAEGGELKMYPSAKLTAPNAVLIYGLFSTRYVANSPDQKVFLKSDLFVMGTGTVWLTKDGLADQFGGLEVDGEMAVGGTLKLDLDGQGANQNESVDRDHIHVTKRTAFAAGAKLRVAYTNATQLPRVKRVWDVLIADLGIGGILPSPVDTRFTASIEGPAQTNLRITHVGEQWNRSLNVPTRSAICRHSFSCRS